MPSLRLPHCLSCSCTPTGSLSPNSYHTSHTSPQPLATPTHNHSHSPSHSHMPSQPLYMPIPYPRMLPPATIASIMHAVYFSSGSFADAVEAVRNDTRLWPYRGARQSENVAERGREWRGMVVAWRRRMSGEEEDVDRDEEERMGSVNGNENENENGNGNGNANEELGQRIGLERAAEENGVQLQEVVQKQEEQQEQTEHAPKKEEVEENHQRQPQSKNEEAKQETPREKQASPMQTSTRTQPIQPTWTQVQLKGQPARPAALTVEAMRTQTQQLEGPVRVQEQRRTGLDIFEFEARRPTGGW